MKTPLEPAYNSSQEGLYDSSTLAWTLCDKYLSDFVQYRSIYKPPFVDNNLKAILDAQNLPALPTRMERRKLLKGEAQQLLKDGLVNFRELKGYITHTWPKGLVRDAKLASAGMANYKSASSRNWEGAGKLLKAGNEFIAANVNDLTANENMPKSFQDKFLTTYTNYTTKLKSYVAEENVKVAESDEKLSANNNIYESLVKLIQDSQCVFESKPLIRSQFVFKNLLTTAGHGGVAGASGLLTEGTGLATKPVSDVEVTVLNGKQVVITGKNGRYRMNLSAGEHLLTFRKEGYETVELTVTIKKGVTSRFNVTMVPMAAGGAKKPLMEVAA